MVSAQNGSSSAPKEELGKHGSGAEKSYFDSEKATPTSTNGPPVDGELSKYFLTADGAEPKRKGLPPLLDHFNSRDLKQLFKASIAVWIYSLFLFIYPTLKAVGSATFFGCIVLIMIPCTGIIFIQILTASTLLIGMCMGWAWGVICMKAALATRPKSQTDARLAQLGREAQAEAPNTVQTSGQSAYSQILIFNGFMLDDRITVTYFSMGCVFIYFMARLRIRLPKLTLTSLFGSIIISVFLTIGPLIPTFQGLLAQLLVKPAAIATGIGIVCNIIFFPESTSHKTIHDMEAVLKPMKGFLNACQLDMQKSDAMLSITALQNVKAKTLMAFKDLEAGLAFLPLDLAVGRWSTEDIGTLREPFAKVVTMFIGLVQLHIDRLRIRDKIQKLEKLGQLDEHDSHDEKSAVGAHQLALSVDLRRTLHNPEQEELLQKSLDALFVSSGDILGSCTHALDALVDAMHTVNTKRFTGRLSKTACEELANKHDAIGADLERHVNEFATRATEHLVDPHEHLFDDQGKLRSKGDGYPPLHGLMLGLMYEERILAVARTLHTLLVQVIVLERARTATKVWFPAGLRHFFTWALGKDSAPAMIQNTNINQQQVERAQEMATKHAPRANSRKQKKEAAKQAEQSVSQRRLTDLRFHGGKQRSRTGRILVSAAQWLTSDESLFGFRMVLVTIALATPAVCKSSAGFFYREKGLWALIMGQMAVAPYTADFVLGFLFRVGGTLVGGTIGLACWYIADGDNGGNSYGQAAIIVPAIIALMWLRLFLPPAFTQATLLCGATFFIVIGYSWADTRIPSYGNPGAGYNVYWERILLVMIGFAAAAIVMFFPKPMSASRHYRGVLAGTVRNMKDYYALLVASWEHPYEGLIETVEKGMLTNAETLGSIAGPIKMLKFEFSMTNYDADTLSKINAMCVTMNSALVQVFMFTSKLPEHLRHRFRRVSGVLDEGLLGDIMAVLTLIEESLKTGDPLPSVIPVPLVARSFSLRKRLMEMDRGEDIITKEMVLDEDFRRYVVVIAALVQFLSAADELVMIIKQSCGETHIVDLEAWPLIGINAEV